MFKRSVLNLIVLLITLIVSPWNALAQSTHEAVASKGNAFQSNGLLLRSRATGFRLMPAPRASASPLFIITPASASPNLPVSGGGTIGRLTKWTGSTNTNSFIGDSTIFEDKFGKVGIGTDTPGSRLTVAGVIETTLGGLKFPDGTLQSTAAVGGLQSIFHDASLTGDGTQANPLGVSVGGINTTHLAAGSVTGAKIAAGTVVRSLNGLFDNITLSAGTNVTITPVGNTLTISAPNALTGVAHDATLQGNGVSGSPLAINIPLLLAGNTSFVMDVANNGAGDGAFFHGGPGFKGLITIGGDLSNSTAGDGMQAQAGTSDTGSGGTGVVAFGGLSNFADGGTGVKALGGTGHGAGNSGGIGIQAFSGIGVNGAVIGLAGRFTGDVDVTGNLSKGGGSFKIDHPLDPANKYLYHSFVESPDMMNIYNGNVTTDSNGEAVVTLPNWFEALNRDFRYQLTVIGEFAQAIIARKMSDNSFTIRTSSPGVEVSWQITGIRQDAWANVHRIPVEEEKSERERGYYLHPELFDQPEEKGIEWARDPAFMSQMKCASQVKADQLQHSKVSVLECQKAVLSHR